MRDSLLAGRSDLARMAAEEQDQDQNDVLASLNKGMLRRMTGDYAGSNQVFEVAKQQIGLLYGVSVTDTATSITISDVTRDYKGARYEQILLHAFMAMNYLQLGQLDAARVEILQADVKMREWAQQSDEDPFVRYLSGIIFEALGEYDQALVAYRKARGIYLATYNEHQLAVPSFLKMDLLRLSAMLGLSDEYQRLKSEFGMAGFEPEQDASASGELIVILSNGLAPIKSESAIMTFSSEIQGNVRVALPVYRYDAKPARKSRVNIGGELVQLEAVENVDRLARRALEEAMPGIMARAVTRAVVKYQSQKAAQDHNDLAGLLLTLTNLVTERADTRSWTTLPQEIQLARVRLPPGRHQVSIEIINAAGGVIDSIDTPVTVQPGRLEFLTRHWVAPITERGSLTRINTNQ